MVEWQSRMALVNICNSCNVLLRPTHIQQLWYPLNIGPVIFVFKDWCHQKPEKRKIEPFHFNVLNRILVNLEKMEDESMQHYNHSNWSTCNVFSPLGPADLDWTVVQVILSCHFIKKWIYFSRILRSRTTFVELMFKECCYHETKCCEIGPRFPTSIIWETISLIWEVLMEME